VYNGVKRRKAVNMSDARWYMEKVQVIKSPQEFRSFLAETKTTYIMGYLGEKDDAGWDHSTSRVHMNLLWDVNDFCYLPINVKAGDFDTLGEIYDIALKEPRVIGFNQTNPHKANRLATDRFGEGHILGDILIREKGEEAFRVADCNGQAGALLLLKLLEVDSLNDICVVIFGGLGASGRLISRAVLSKGAKRLIIVDIAPDNGASEKLSGEFGIPVDYTNDFTNIEKLTGRIGFVNATRHQDARTGVSILSTIDEYQKPENALVDLLMGGGEELEGIEMPNASGEVYVAYTNYALACLISQTTGLEGITFEYFHSKVLISEGRA